MKFVIRAIKSSFISTLFIFTAFLALLIISCGGDGITSVFWTPTPTPTRSRIQIPTPPPIALRAHPSPPYSPGQEITISVDISGITGDLRYTWESVYGEIVAGQGTQIIEYRAPNQPGTYDVGLTVDWDGQSITRSIQIEVPVTPTPTPDIIAILTLTTTSTLTETTLPPSSPTVAAPSPTNTPSPTVTHTPVPSPTDTPVPISTPTPTHTPSNTPTFTSTPTTTPTFTPTPTPTPIDRMDTLANWVPLEQNESTINIDLTQGNTDEEIDQAMEISYELINSGEYVVIYKEFNSAILLGTQQIGFWYKGSGAFNTLELKLFHPEEVCDNGERRRAIFSVDWSRATNTNDQWVFQMADYSAFQYWAGNPGNPDDPPSGCTPNESLDLTKVDKLEFAISNRPHHGDEAGQGIVVIDDVQAQ
jgi:hypothetical protein